MKKTDNAVDSSIKETSLDVLKENLEGFLASVNWLRRSYNCCITIGIKIDYTEDEIDQFENLTSRYARTTDLLINKLFRSIDAVEFITGGTLIDVVNRAEQRDIINSVSDIRDIKDLRNEIAHEYSPTELWELFDAVLKAVPKLLEISEHAVNYCGRYKSEI